MCPWPGGFMFIGTVDALHLPYLCPIWIRVLGVNCESDWTRARRCRCPPSFAMCGLTACCIAPRRVPTLVTPSRSGVVTGSSEVESAEVGSVDLLLQHTSTAAHILRFNIGESCLSPVHGRRCVHRQSNCHMHARASATNVRKLPRQTLQKPLKQRTRSVHYDATRIMSSSACPI